MTESEVRESIHKMSHQKIRADEKWGALLMTQERIERLIVVVNSNEYNTVTYTSIFLKDGKRAIFPKPMTITMPFGDYKVVQKAMQKVC
ncbi:hypothetical protein CR194_12120 [Salipaludibacillus keqinensis]|uniref:Uncharacterized protein n=1 Tax=Salipaludibacillus keqinensis TaxID=2045207 RepID=A0A323TJT3_9BACI|nr:DUF6241 domain-containing protein [Salipaludibacillus keqinensis]PYZ93877.1 hypothetical protein CR194_12120 [Salipaludibacillus keqinensis]